MTGLLARAVQMSDLTNDLYQRVHSYEKRIGRCLTPYEIFIKCGLNSHGDIDDESQGRADKVIYGIYNAFRNDMWEACNRGEEWDEVILVHWTDDEMKKRGLDFGKKPESSVYDKVRSKAVTR